MMLLHLHPTRPEALTASTTTLTRWSLATNPATILAQMSTAPESVFKFMYDRGGRLLTYGGVTGSPDGLFFAHEQLNPQQQRWADPCVMEWRRWEDLSPVRSISVPHTRSPISSLANSPNGRWLVIEGMDKYEANLLLLDWQTGEVISFEYCYDGCQYICGLAFDSTSTFIAGLSFQNEGGALQIWQLDPIEHTVGRPAVKDCRSHEDLPQDDRGDKMILTLVHGWLDREGIAWDREDLGGAGCISAFSPDGRIVVFCLYSCEYRLELVAYEVVSGKRLWCVRDNEVESAGPFTFTPDGSALLVPLESGDLLRYRIEDGTLVQRLPSGLSEPVQALSFAHDGTTLWLATKEALVQYQSKG